VARRGAAHGAALPPGPHAPAALQTVAWVVRPTDLLRRCAARYGEPFTLRTLWADAPMVLVSDPETVQRIYAAPPEQLHGGASSEVLVPFVGARSILLLDGEPHRRARKLVLPAFHGERMAAHRATIAALAAAEVARWPSGGRLRTLPRMQELTLDLILRVVLGKPDPALRTALRAALDETASTGRLIALSLAPRGAPPWRRLRRAVVRADVELARVLAAHRPQDPPVVLDDLLAAGADGAELRDQVVTLLAAGHETTAGALAWALERLARHPTVAERLREDDDAYLDAVVREVLRTRPVLSITPRRVAAPFALPGGWSLPPGVHVAPCPYLAHRRPELWPDPTRFAPERFLTGAPAPYAWLPFGGGARRCAGAAFAAMELREVLRAVVARVSLAPDRTGGERMRRRGVTLAPTRGGRVIIQRIHP